MFYEVTVHKGAKSYVLPMHLRYDLNEVVKFLSDFVDQVWIDAAIDCLKKQQVFPNVIFFLSSEGKVLSIDEWHATYAKVRSKE